MANKFPANIGACIDKLYTLRAQRLEMQRKVDEIKERENELEEHVLAVFSKTELEGAKGKQATAGIIRQTVPTVNDWDKFYDYVHKNKAFELLERRVSRGAFKERLDANEVVPGVEPFMVVKLSLTKRG